MIHREGYAEFDVGFKAEMIRALVPLGLMRVAELLYDEVTELAGARHARKESSMGGRRHGSNPGTAKRVKTCVISNHLHVLNRYALGDWV